MHTAEVHKDNSLDRLFIWLFSRKMANAIGSTTEGADYEGFVDLSKQIMQGRNAQEQQAVVAKVLPVLGPGSGAVANSDDLFSDSAGMRAECVVCGADV